MLEFRKREPEAWNLVRRIASNAVEVAPDKQGRILVPSWLQEAAQLGGAVVLSGNLDRIEIWNPELYRTQVEGASPVDAQRFTHQVFG